MLQQASYRGHICAICDNSALFLKGFRQAVRLTGWVDRWAKSVLVWLPVSRYREYWIPAQHDTGDMSLAAQWQKVVDGLATSGLQSPEAFPVPWADLQGSLSNTPHQVWYRQCLVLKPGRFFDQLYTDILSSSPLVDQLQMVGYDLHIWRAVCESPEVSLATHRVTAYLHLIVHVSRVFFDTPACRFCGMFFSNEPGHVSVCAALYI